MRALFQKLIDAIANEPVATITLVVGGGITWLFSHFSFLPPVSDTTRNSLITLVVALVGWIVRQYVTPSRKIPAIVAAAATGGDGQANVGAAEPPAAPDVPAVVVAPVPPVPPVV